MRNALSWIAVLTLAACASAPRGPSDAEVRATLEASLAELVANVGAGMADPVVGRFLPQGTLVLDGIMGPTGDMLNTTLTGAAQIRAFLQSVGAPPQFTMTPTTFARSGAGATQTGTWSIGGGEQGGSFVLEWTQAEDGTWRIRSWTVSAG